MYEYYLVRNIIFIFKIMFRLAFYFPMILSTGLLLSEKDEGIMSRIMVAGNLFLDKLIMSDFFKF